MEFKEGHTEDMKVISKQGKSILGVLGGMDLSILKKLKKGSIPEYGMKWLHIILSFNLQIMKF